MPQRTNEFQQIALLIQRALVPKGAKVTESPLASDPGTFGEREIDILIETEVGPYKVKIAVEAKDEGRKMDSTKFESILGKYLVEGGVKVNKIVVITHHGFYQPVIDRAKQLKVDLYTLDQAALLDWTTLLPTQMSLRIPPHLCGFSISPRIDESIADEILRFGTVTCVHGHNHGTMLQLLAGRLIPQALAQHSTVFQELERVATTGSTGEAKADLSTNLDHPMVIRHGEQSFPIEGISFRIHLISGRGNMEYKMCRLSSVDGDTTELQLGEVVIAGKRIRLMMPDGLKSKQIVVRFDAV
jgi:hypothetical protein